MKPQQGYKKRPISTKYNYHKAISQVGLLTVFYFLTSTLLATTSSPPPILDDVSATALPSNTSVQNEAGLKSDSSWTNALEEIIAGQLSDKTKSKVLSRAKRTLIIMRESNPDRAGRVGDNCSFEDWKSLVKVVYERANLEGAFTDEGGIATARNTMAKFQEHFKFENSSTPDDPYFRTWGSKYCIGKYPMECNNSSKTCKCLNFNGKFVNLYKISEEMGTHRCFIRNNTYCNPTMNMYCEKRLKCVGGLCREVKVHFGGVDRVISGLNQLGSFIYTLVLMLGSSLSLMYFVMLL